MQAFDRLADRQVRFEQFLRFLATMNDRGMMPAAEIAADFVEGRTGMMASEVNRDSTGGYQRARRTALRKSASRSEKCFAVANAISCRVGPRPRFRWAR